MKATMPKAIKQEWLEALRSGEYKQGEGFLSNPAGICHATTNYCCLGVLQMVVDGKVETNDVGRSLMLPSMPWLKKHNITFPNSEGVPCDELSVQYGDITENVAHLNDVTGLTFLQLADLIEASLDEI